MEPGRSPALPRRQRVARGFLGRRAYPPGREVRRLLAGDAAGYCERQEAAGKAGQVPERSGREEMTRRELFKRLLAAGAALQIAPPVLAARPAASPASKAIRSPKWLKVSALNL